MTILPAFPVALPLAESVRAIVEIEVLIVLTLVAMLIALAAAVLFVAWHRAKGTTLRAPIIWTAISIATLIAVNAVQIRYRAAETVRIKWDFIAATSALCPAIALLGAKRPQNRAWQCIVIAMWGIVALPAIESLIIHPQDAFELHPLWQFFVGLLILVGTVNYLPTRFAIPAIIATFGQSVLLGGPMFGANAWLRNLGTDAFKILPILAADGKTPGLRIWLIIGGIAPLAAAVCLAFLLAKKPRRPAADSLTAWNQIWRDFASAFGLVWATRVMERVNAQAQLSEAVVRLSWSGFYRISTEAGPRWTDSIGPLEPPLRNLLRRFVSDGWIDARLPNSQPASASHELNSSSV